MIESEVYSKEEKQNLSNDNFCSSEECPLKDTCARFLEGYEKHFVWYASEYGEVDCGFHREYINKYWNF